MTQHRSVPAPFLTKTYHLVGDPTTDEVISWGKDGTTFVVWKTAELSRDLLPVYFKHNNFSSFIRQLNTYGFRKIVPDKWEFLNENFKQGSPELLHKIRRRKNINNTPGKANGNANAVPSDSNSVEDLSTSASSSKNQAASEDEPLICAKLADLSNENENLKKHNEMLISELAQSKKQCEELVAFLSKNLNLDAAKLHCILENVTCSSSSSKETVVNSDNDESMDEGKDDNDESVYERKDDKGLKLFGVLLHGNNKQNEKRRCVEDGIGYDYCQSKKMKGAITEAVAPWMKMFSGSGGSNKVSD